MVLTENEAWRVLDANANRAAEGLRTLEEFARLVREDELVVESVKEIRHGLAEALRPYERRLRLANRSTEADAGTEVTTASEAKRSELADLVPAAAERVTQALRQLEEFGKLVAPELGEVFKKLRYEAYDRLAQVELQLTAQGMGKCGWSAPSLYLLVDCELPIEEFIAYLKSLAEAGVDWFQLRDKEADGGKLVQYGRAAVSALEQSRSGVVINDRIDVALACGADAVHLGQEDIGLAEARRLVGRKLQVGISTHDLSQALDAERGGADYIGCGPTFPSGTKQFEEFAGTAFLQEVAGEVKLPFFAIGGVDLINAEQVVASGCRSVAVSGVINRAENPVAAARELKSRLRGK